MELLKELLTILLFPETNPRFQEAFVKLNTAPKLDPTLLGYIQTLCRYKRPPLVPLSTNIDWSKSIPNLFKVDPKSLEYILMIPILNKLVDDRNSIMETILDEFQQFVLDLKETPKPYVELLICALALRKFFGKAGGDRLVEANQAESKTSAGRGDQKDKEDSKESKAKNKQIKLLKIREQIEQFLQTARLPDDMFPSMIPTLLLTPLNTLRKFLHSPDKELRLEAREICEALLIPLTLPHMVSLSIDGIEKDNAELKEGKEQKTTADLPLLKDNTELKKPKEQKTNADLLLVIGPTGSGKSTLINCFSGVDYQRIVEPVTRTPYLHPKPENTKTPPAKVGNSSKSETLYPKVIYNEDFAWVDCPGFDDTRTNEQAACASLGVPLAVHNASKIRAVVITLEWRSTDLNAGGREGKEFRMLAKTLASLFKSTITKRGIEPAHPIGDTKSSDGNKGQQGFLPALVFAVTKPPVPERDETFETDVLKTQCLNRIEKLYQSRVSEYEMIEKKQFDVDQYLLRIGALKQCLQAFKSLIADSTYLKSKGKLGGFLGILGGVSSTSLQLSYESNITVLLDYIGKTQTLTLEAQNILKIALKPVVSAKDDEASILALSKQMDSWTTELDSLQTKHAKESREIDELQGEKEIFELMLRDKGQNIFIIRGYKDSKQDQDDHQQALKEYLVQLRQSHTEIHPSDFEFDPRNPQFEKIHIWTTEFVIKNNRPIQGLVTLPDKIAQVSKEIETKKKEEKTDREQLRSAFSGKIQKVDATHPVVKAIKEREEQLQSLKVQSSKLEATLKECEEGINEIMHATQMEYASRAIREERSWLGKTFNAQTYWTYRFPFGYYDAGSFSEWFGWTKRPPQIVPIHSIQMSCVIDEAKKIVFRYSSAEKIEAGHDLKKVTVADSKVPMEFSKKDRNIFTVLLPKSSSYTLTGKFDLFPDNDLDTGQFRVTYQSKAGEDGYAAVRVFVLPQHLPLFIERKETLRLRRKLALLELQSVHRNILTTLEMLRMDKLHLDLLSKGLKPDQSAEIARIAELALRIGLKSTELFSPQSLDLFPSELYPLLITQSSALQTHLQWLKTCDFQILEEFRVKNLADFLINFRDQPVLVLIFGQEPKAETKDNATDKYLSPEDASNLFSKVPKRFFEDCLELCRQTGLSLKSIREILIKVDEPQPPTYESLREWIARLTIDMYRKQYFWQQLKETYLESRLMFRSFEKVRLLFNTSGRHIDEFVRNYQKFERDLLNQNYEAIPDANKDSVIKSIKPDDMDIQCYGLDRTTLIESLTKRSSISLSEHLFEQARDQMSKQLRYTDAQWFGYMPTHTLVNFDEFEVLDNGTYFQVMGITREAGCSHLLSLGEKVEVREGVASDIINLLGTSDRELFDVTPVATEKELVAESKETSTATESNKLGFQYDELRKHQIKLPDLIKEANALRPAESQEEGHQGYIDNISDLISLYQKLTPKEHYELMLQRLEEYVATEDQLKQSIDELARSAVAYKAYISAIQNRAWLGRRAATLLAQTNKTLKTTLYCWDRKQDSTELTLDLKATHVADDDDFLSPTPVHMRYGTGSNCYSFLTPVPASGLLLKRKSKLLPKPEEAKVDKPDKGDSKSSPSPAKVARSPRS